MLYLLIRLVIAVKLIVLQPMVSLGLGAKPSLSILEKTLLTKLESSLPYAEAEVLRSQLAEINLLERVDAPNTVVTFKKVKNFSYAVSREKKFKQDMNEYILSIIDFTVRNEAYRAVFYVAYGNFYSIEFSKNIAAIHREVPVLNNKFTQQSFG